MIIINQAKCEHAHLTDGYLSQSLPVVKFAQGHSQPWNSLCLHDYGSKLERTTGGTANLYGHVYIKDIFRGLPEGNCSFFLY